MLLLWILLILFTNLTDFNSVVEAEEWPRPRVDPDEASMYPAMFLGQGYVYVPPQLFPFKNWTGQITGVNFPPGEGIGWFIINTTSYLHRVIWDNGTHILTKGDNNAAPEPNYVPKSWVDEIVIFIFPRFFPGRPFLNWRIAWVIYMLPATSVMSYTSYDLLMRDRMGKKRRLWKHFLAAILLLGFLDLSIFTQFFGAFSFSFFVGWLFLTMYGAVISFRERK